MTRKQKVWKEGEHEHSNCVVCQDHVSTHPDAGALSLSFCGDCSEPTCSAHRSEDGSQRCTNCQNKRFLHAYGKGTSDYYRNKIVMQSENFIVIRTPGHSDWSGVGSRDYYPSNTVLIGKGKWCLDGDREQWDGRISKKILKQRLDLAEKRGYVEKKYHQQKDSTRLMRGLR